MSMPYPLPRPFSCDYGISVLLDPSCACCSNLCILTPTLSGNHLPWGINTAMPASRCTPHACVDTCARNVERSSRNHKISTLPALNTPWEFVAVIKDHYPPEPPQQIRGAISLDAYACLHIAPIIMHQLYEKSTVIIRIRIVRTHILLKEV